MPLSGLSISAVGDHVVVREGETRRQVERGQYLLGFDVSVQNGVLHVVEHGSCAPRAGRRVRTTGSRRRSRSRAAIRRPRSATVQRAVDADPQNAAPGPTGDGCCTSGADAEAAEVYRRALERVGADALLLFNQAVLLEDLGDAAAALAAYRSALEEDPDLADCHYNLARLYESMG